MLEILPSALGRALRGRRPGIEKLALSSPEITRVYATLEVTSDAFSDGNRIPLRYTADGEKVSPPLSWAGVPTGSAEIALLIEDADSPTPEPLVHALSWGLPGSDGALPEGALSSSRGVQPLFALGRNSYLRTSYLPPDPPPGHGSHRYAFQVFALDRPLDFKVTPGRGALLRALCGHVLASGCIIGTYERK